MVVAFNTGVGKVVPVANTVPFGALYQVNVPIPLAVQVATLPAQTCTPAAAGLTGKLTPTAVRGLVHPPIVVSTKKTVATVIGGVV